MDKNDINIPRFDPEEESPPLPPFERRVAGQIDWIRYYIAQTESSLRTQIGFLWFLVIVLCFAVGFLFARCL